MLRRSAARFFTKKASGLVLVDSAGDDRIAVVTLNNPDKLNALTVDMGNEFVSVVEDLKADKELRGVIVTGAGRAFSAGGDLAFLKSRVAIGTEDTTHSINKEEMLRFYARFLSLKTLEVPVIAALNGHAVGAGLCMAMAADIRITAANAKLSVNFTRIGIHPGMAASYHLPRLVGPQRAAQMILTGAPVTGEESVPMGLCLKSLPAEEVLPASITLMKEIIKADALCTNQAVLTLRSDVDSQDAATDRESTCQSYNFREGGAVVDKALEAMIKRA